MDWKKRFQLFLDMFRDVEISKNQDIPKSKVLVCKDPKKT
jgi:hypothetical protein